MARVEPATDAVPGATTSKAKKTARAKTEPAKQEPSKSASKQRPRFVVEAVALLAIETLEGKVGLGALGQYLKRTDPAFSPQTYGHSGLLNMVKTYDLLVTRQEEGGHWTVSLAAKGDAGADES